MFFKIGSIKNFAILTGKHLCWSLFFKKLQTFRPATLLRRDSNIFRKSFLTQHLQWLLLTVLPWYSKVSSSACSGLHVLLILMKNLHRTLLKYFFTITRQNNFFFAWIDWSRAFNFRICFGKTLIAFDFDENFTQCVAQVTITCQKTFFPCTLRLVRCFQFQGMIWKTEECRVSKNIALKTWRWKSRFLLCSGFVYYLFCVLSLL